MSTQWNEEEDAALDYLPHVDQVIYLRGIRRRMNYQTGIAGKDRPISYSWLAQLVEVRPERGSHLEESGGMTRSALRSSFARLERAGLVQRIPTPDRGLVFECLLASREQSVSRRNDPRTTPERPQRNDPCIDNENSGLGAMNDLRTTPCCTARNDPIQVSGIKEEAKASLSTKPGGLADLFGDPGLVGNTTETTSNDPHSGNGNVVPLCPHKEIIDLYHRLLPGLPGIVISRWRGSKSEMALRTRWKEDKRHQSLDFWERFFSAAEANPRWTGRSGLDWKADLHWLVKRQNFDKVLSFMVNQREAAHG
jgi:hypothetical protein